LSSKIEYTSKCWWSIKTTTVSAPSLAKIVRDTANTNKIYSNGRSRENKCGHSESTTAMNRVFVSAQPIYHGHRQRKRNCYNCRDFGHIA